MHAGGVLVACLALRLHMAQVSRAKNCCFVSNGGRTLNFRARESVWRSRSSLVCLQVVIVSPVPIVCHGRNVLVDVIYEGVSGWFPLFLSWPVTLSNHFISLFLSFPFYTASRVVKS